MRTLFKNCVIYVLVLFLVVCIAYDIAFAELAFTNNEGQFIADNPVLSFQNFSAANVPFGSISGCQPDLVINEDSDNNCLPPGSVLPGIQFSQIPFGNALTIWGEDFFSSMNPANILAPSNSGADIQIEFFPTASAVGLTLGCAMIQQTCNGTIKLDVFGSGDVLLGSTEVEVTNSANSFIGIESDVLITRITIVEDELPNDTIFPVLVNVRFGLEIVRNVPTLSEWGLIAMAGILGLVGFIAIRKRYTVS